MLRTAGEVTITKTMPGLMKFSSVCFCQGKSFAYHPNPLLFPLNRDAPDAPYHFKAGGVIAVEVQ